MIQLMTVPLALMAEVGSGAAYVAGALVKDSATHQVLAHLQPTGALAQALGSAALAPGPLSIVELASELGQHAQLLHIEQMLEQLQAVASIGAGAAVLNLGVSLGGFALVLRSLHRMEGKLSTILDITQDIHARQLLEHAGKVASALDRCEGAFASSSTAERHRYWREAEWGLHQAAFIAVKQLAHWGVDLEALDSERDAGMPGRLFDSKIVILLQWLLLLCNARGEALLALQDPGEAARMARTLSGWLDRLPFATQELLRAQAGTRIVSPARLQQLAVHARSVTTLLQRAHDGAAERALLCDTLRSSGVDTLEYVLTVRRHPRPEMLMLPHANTGERLLVSPP